MLPLELVAYSYELGLILNFLMGLMSSFLQIHKHALYLFSCFFQLESTVDSSLFDRIIQIYRHNILVSGWVVKQTVRNFDVHNDLKEAALNIQEP